MALSLQKASTENKTERLNSAPSLGPENRKKS